MSKLFYITIPFLILSSTISVASEMSSLSHLASRSIESGSDTVIVVRDGTEIFRLIANGKEPQPIELMSMTKSFLNLAIGFLIDEGKIKSIDDPVSRWFDVWKTGPKCKITLRQLLNHTSGLSAQRMADDIYQQKDFVQYALSADLKTEPGTEFFYNNRAVNLLPAIVKKASGLPIDRYLKNKLFEPLGIKTFTWKKDDVGNVMGMAGLSLAAPDLAKIGELILNRGAWKKRRLLSERWIALSMTPSSLGDSGTHGLLWWLHFDDWSTAVTESQINAYRVAGVDPGLVELLIQSKDDLGFHFNQLKAQHPEMASALMKFDDLLKSDKIPYPQQVPVGQPFAFGAEGALGQQLIILPAQKIVGVRQKIKRTAVDEANSEMAFKDFPQLLHLIH